MAVLKIWDGTQWIEVPLVSNHGELTGLGSDHHLQYIRGDGFRNFTSTISGIDPIEPEHLSTKYYVDNRPHTLTVGKLQPNEDISFFYTPTASTVTSLLPTIAGATASGTTWTVRFASDRYAVGTEIVVGGINTHSGIGGNNATIITSLSNPNIPGNNFVWLETSTASGIIDEFSLTMF